MFLKRMLMKPVGDLTLKEIFICLCLLIVIFNTLIYFTSVYQTVLSSSTKFEKSLINVRTTTLLYPLSEQEKFDLINGQKSVTFANGDAAQISAFPSRNIQASTTSPYLQTTIVEVEEKRRSWPIPPSSPCKRPKSGRLKDDGRWFDFGTNGMFLFAYTALVDDREALESDPVVRIIGVATIIENMAHPPNLYCRLYYSIDADGNFVAGELNYDDDDGGRVHKDAYIDMPVEKNPIRKIGMGWQLNYKLVREYIFTCPLPTVKQLKNLPNVNGKSLDNLSQVIHPRWLTLLIGGIKPEEVTSCMPVETPDKPTVKKDFALCVQIGYGSIDPVQLVEWMELQKILGVDVIGFYDMEIHEPAMQVLRYYAEEEGLVDLRRSDYIPNGPTQYLLHGSPVINDCMYRHIHTHRYLLVYDIDEVILPKKNSSNSDVLNNFRDLMVRIEERYGKEKYLYLFRNHYFFFDSSPDPDEPSEFRLLKYRKSVPVSNFGYSTKSITDMQSCIQMHNHFCWGYTKKFESMTLLDVDTNLATNQHYKKCHLTPAECAQLLENSYRNNAIASYKDELVKNVYKVVDIIRRKAKESNIKDPFVGHFKEIVS